MTDPSASNPGHRFERLLLTLAGAAALVPVAAIALRHALSGLPRFSIDGDWALVALGISRAARLEQLLGPYSRVDFHHPGPALFYLHAPAWLASEGNVSALVLGAALVNLVMLALALGAVLRGATSPFGRAAGLLAVGLFAASQIPRLASIWNPYAPLLPFLAALFASAAVLAGRTGWLPVAAAGASFAVQCHVGYVPSALGLAAVVMLGVLAPPFRRRLGLAAEGESFSLRRPLVATSIVIVLFWAPVLIEELRGNPGNLTRLIGSFGTVTSTPRPMLEVAAVVLSRLGALFAGPSQGAATFFEEGSPLSALPGLAMLLLLPLAAIRSARRGDRWGTAIAVVAVATLPGGAIWIRSIPGELFEHLPRPITPIGPLLLVSAVGAIRPSRPTKGVFAAAVAALLLAAIAAASLARVSRLPSLESRSGEPRFLLVTEAAVAARRDVLSRGLVRPRLEIPFDEPAGVADGLVLFFEQREWPLAVEPRFEWRYGATPASGPSDGRLLLIPSNRKGDPLLPEGGRVLLEGSGATLLAFGR